MAVAAAPWLGQTARAAAPVLTRLDGPRRAPTTPPARFLIVLLHGFGSDGADLIGLAPELQPYLPSAAFASPNAPFRIDGGYSWASAEDRAPSRGLSAEAASGGAVLAAFIDAELARYSLAPDRLILIGFSQGASLALNAGLRRPTPPAAVIAFAGSNIVADGLPPGAKRPPVLLAQGKEDPRVRPEGQSEALKILEMIGAPAQGHILPGLEHGIDGREIRLAGELIRSVTQAMP